MSYAKIKDIKQFIRLVDANEILQKIEDSDISNKEEIIELIDSVPSISPPTGYRLIDANCWEYFGKPEEV